MGYSPTYSDTYSEDVIPIIPNASYLGAVSSVYRPAAMVAAISSATKIVSQITWEYVEPPYDPDPATSFTIITGTWLEVEAGCELLEPDGTLVADISEDLQDGSITHDNTRSVHGVAQFRISRELEWHRQQLKPYVTLRDIAGNEERFNLGVYLPDTPSRVQGETPLTYDVEAYDRLTILNTPYGASLSLDATETYLGAIEDLLIAAGLTTSQYSISQVAAAATLPTDFVWELDEKNTYLKIINDLLLGIGYLELYADENGVFQAIPYVFPQDLAASWDYNADDEDTIVVEGMTAETDLHEIPNKWVFYRDDPDQDLPSEGDGIYTVVNQSDGDTSVDGRGRTITKIVRITVASDQEALEIIGNRIIAQDKRPRTTLSMSSGINPTHFHYQTVTVTASDIGIDNEKYMQEVWTLYLDGRDMTHTLRKV